MQPQRNWRDLIKPQKLETDEKSLTATYGKFVGEPFERGFGTTIGNALRRVLLSSLLGRRDHRGAHRRRPARVLDAAGRPRGRHRHRPQPEGSAPQAASTASQDTVRLEAKGEGVVTRRRHPGRPDASRSSTPSSTSPRSRRRAQLTCRADDQARPRLRVRRAQQGRGRPGRDDPASTRSSRPIRKVNYTVTNARVGQRTDYDRLTLEVWTDGSVRPDDARRLRRPHPAGPARASSSTSRRRPEIAEPDEEISEAERQREPLPPGRRARALRALGELPAERRHQVHRRAGAAHRGRDAEDQELRPQVAQRDQGDPARDGPRLRHAPRELPEPRGARPPPGAREGEAQSAWMRRDSERPATQAETSSTGARTAAPCSATW